MNHNGTLSYHLKIFSLIFDSTDRTKPIRYFGHLQSRNIKYQDKARYYNSYRRTCNIFNIRTIRNKMITIKIILKYNQPEMNNNYVEHAIIRFYL
jgi:hypothetical protein